MKLKQFISLIFISLFSCNNPTGTNSNKNKIGTSLQSNTSKIIHPKKLLYKIDTIFSIDSNVILLGDTSKFNQNDISAITVKFKTHIQFSDFRVDTFNKKIKATIKYSSNFTAI
jgi:hypothetical protein